MAAYMAAYMAYFLVHSFANWLYFSLSVLKILAISGTRGSSGLGSQRRLQMERRTCSKVWLRSSQIAHQTTASRIVRNDILTHVKYTLWSRVYGAECIGHVFNLAEGENTSSTIRKHP